MLILISNCNYNFLQLYETSMFIDFKEVIFKDIL